jgi:hypothetical protein
MMNPTQPRGVLRRAFENAGILSFASLLVMSVALGRYTGALVWCGALLVFFAHAWEGSVLPRHEAATDAAPAAARRRRFDALRGVGVALALAGAFGLAV